VDTYPAERLGVDHDLLRLGVEVGVREARPRRQIIERQLLERARHLARLPGAVPANLVTVRNVADGTVLATTSSAVAHRGV